MLQGKGIYIEVGTNIEFDGHVIIGKGEIWIHHHPDKVF